MAVLRFSPVVAQFPLRVFSPTRVATWRAFEVVSQGKTAATGSPTKKKDPGPKGSGPDVAAGSVLPGADTVPNKPDEPHWPETAQHVVRQFVGANTGTYSALSA